MRLAAVVLLAMSSVLVAAAGPTSSPPGTPAPIEAFPDLEVHGATRTTRVNELAADRRLLLLQGAIFDPVAQGTPDLSEYVPELAGYDRLPADAMRHFIVQLDHPVGVADLARLRAAGIEPLFYVPNDGYLVRGDASAVARALPLPGVRWLGRFQPGFKVQRGLGGSLPALRRKASAEDASAEHRLTVLLTPGADPEVFRRSLLAALPGVEVLGAAESRGIGLVVLRTVRGRLPDEVTALANLEDVLWIETWQPHELATDDAVWIEQSYDRVNQRNYALTTTVWNHGIQGAGQILGISGTGVDPDVCWMIDTVQGVIPASSVPANGPGSGPMPVNPSRRKIIGYNLLGWFDAPATAYDEHDHETFVAACALGDNPAHLANESITDGSHHDTGDGVAPLAKLVVEDIYSEQFPCANGRVCPPEILDDMFVQMYQAGARISSNSWGLSVEYGVSDFFADRMTWTHPDFLTFFVAGNSGPLVNTVVSHAKNIVTVGGSENGLGAGLDPEDLGVGSSRGPASDGRIKPDVVAPYSPIISADSDNAASGQTCVTKSWGGTSLATPLAAGAALLVREYFTDGWYPSGTKAAADGFTPSAALIKGMLLNGARNLTGNDGGDDVGPCVLVTHRCSGLTSLPCTTSADCFTEEGDDAPSSFQGYGRVMLEDALYFAGDSRDLRVWDVPREKGVATGDSWKAQFHVASGTETLEALLTWSDPPGLIAAQSNLVNDLDLHLTAPDGTEYWGNSLETRDGDNTTVEQTAPNVRKPSRIDNVEYARRKAGSITPGVWTVEVLGTSVPGSPLWVGESSLRQGFAIVVTGDLSDGGGTVSLDADRYSCDDTVTVAVRDTNAGGSVSAVITTSSGDVETLVLPSSGGGNYSAFLPTSGATAIVAGDGTLEVVEGETLRVTYADANPVQTASDEAVVACTPELHLGLTSIAGGCDGDGYLDAGEEVQLVVNLVNAAPKTAQNVRARLVADGTAVHVRPGQGSFGNIAPGASASNGGTPFLVSAPSTTASLSAVTLRLEVVADGLESPLSLDVPLTLEADQVVTPGSYSESFDAVALTCVGKVCSGNSGTNCSSDANCTGVGRCTGLTPVPAASWSYLDLDANCGSTEATWQFRSCNGNASAAVPGCNGTVGGNGVGAVQHWLISPVIPTGAAGSTTTLQQLTLTESVAATINADQSFCDQLRVWIRTVPDDERNETEYVRLRSVNLSNQPATADFSQSVAWTVPPLPPATHLQILVAAHLDDDSPPNVSFACTPSDAESVRWIVRDLQLTWQNRAVVPDVTAPCSPGCTTPAVPGGLTVTQIEPGVMAVGWNPVAAADHYDLYRSRNGAPASFLARVIAPQTTYEDAVPDDATYAYSVRAVSANGLCTSATSATAQQTSTAGCRIPPSAPTGLTVADDGFATCSQTLNWGAASAGCSGHAVEYRVYRGSDAGFVPGPGSLLATTAATSFADSDLASGYDAGGEPTGTAYFYLVRAVDAATGVEESNLAAVSGRAGGPAFTGAWSDDGGDLDASKLIPTTAVDQNQVGAGWSRTILGLDHQAGGRFTYWTGADPVGDGEYENLACIRLQTSPLELALSGSSMLTFWVDYRIDYQRDGLVVDLSANGGAFNPITPVGGYPGSFARTEAPPCVPSGGSGSWVNACGYPPSQGAITGPAPDASELSGWQQYTFNLGAFQGSTVVIRFNLSSDCNTKGTAILDEVQVSDVLLPTDCMSSGCLPPPSFAGIVSAADLDPSLDTGVRITWGGVSDWGGGGAGIFKVYRSGLEVATLGPGVSSYDDNAAPDNKNFTYIVQASSGGGCGLGDGNTAALHGVDCVDASAAAAVLTVDKGGTVILRSTPIPSAGAYRFLYANNPSQVAGSANALASPTPEARHDVLLDGLNYFYLLEDAPSEACTPAP